MNRATLRTFLLTLATLMGGFCASAHAAALVVTTNADSGAGSLRDAITRANANSEADIITFNISGPGLHTINLASALPPLLDTVSIDGTSQPGSSVNTSTTGSNAVLQIAINGGGTSGYVGFSVLAKNCLIKGIAMGGLSGGINIGSSNATGNHVEGCFIGTDAAGTRAIPNANNGVDIYDGASNNVIGGTTLASRNVISANTFRGVLLTTNGGGAPTANTVAGNLIGTDATGVVALSNGDFGVYLDGATGTSVNGNVISGNTGSGVAISGTTATGNAVTSNYLGTNSIGAILGNGARGVLISGGAKSNSIGSNVIAFNTDAGVSIYDDASTANSIRGNSIYGNGGSGIKLMTSDQFDQDKPTPNDALDADAGPNNAQNWPVISSFTGGILGGVLNSAPNSSFTIDIYGNSDVDASGFGEGRFYLGSVPGVQTDANGHATWSFTPGAGGDGQSFSATATSAASGTSEFGPAGVAGVVTNTNDSGGGSLRNALNIANQLPGTTILFNIPKTDAGYAGGVYTIKPTAGLPWMVAAGTVVDGASQKLFDPGSNPVGPAVVLSGASLPGQTFQSGLTINASNCTIRGLAINGFIEGSGIDIYAGGNSTQLTNDHVEGCYIGTDATGTAVVANNRGLAMQLEEPADSITLATIGGAAAQRNVIAGNSDYALVMGGANISGNTISGNYFGTDRTGGVALNGDATVLAIVGGAHNNIIGGTTTGAGNLIVGFSAVAIRDSGTDGNVIQNNFIGTNAAGTARLATDGVGITLDTGPKNTLIGGAGVGNILAVGDTGILMIGASANMVQGNYIGVNKSSVRIGGKIGVHLFDSPGNMIGGNIIAANNQAGLVLGGVNCAANKVQGNLIGGTSAVGNAIGIRLEDGAKSNFIGVPGAGNAVTGNRESGISLSGAGTSSNRVQANTIGISKTGDALGNGQDGILLDAGASGNVIGTTTGGTAADISSSGNRIANNGGDGIALEGTTVTLNTLRGNLITSNGGLGINLRASSGEVGVVTANDTGDGDTGPNSLQNFPLLTVVTVSGGQTVVKGTLNSTPSSTFVIDLFDNSVIEPSGFGEGAVYVATQSVTTDSSGNAAFIFTLNGSSFGGLFTATATNAGGATSEFGPQGGSGVVLNTLDSGPGSLRSAILLANTLPGTTIQFNIPTTDSGFKNGVFTIQPLTALPALTGAGTKVDGASQTSFGGSTNSKGPEVVIDGAKMSAKPAGFKIDAANCVVQNLVITHFDAGVMFDQAAATGGVVQGCYIGVGADGTTAAGNVTGVSVYYGASKNLIGGDTAGECNVISGNSGDGINISGPSTASTKVQGNYIGTNASGTGPVANGGAGITISESTSNLIGGTTGALRNVISGNSGNGITSAGGVLNQILGNYIGTDASGAVALANSNSGVEFFGGNGVVGTTATGAGNRIAFNRFYGVSVSDFDSTGTNHVTIRGNQVYSNGLLGINLFGGTESYYGGVTTNDEAAKDADTGPNGLQNYPVITGYSASGTTTTIRGTLSTAASRSYNLDFYRVTRPDDSGYGEGDAYLGSASVTTDENGLANFTFSGSFTGQYFAATATDAVTGDTSEFSSASVAVKITDFTPQMGPVGTAVTIKGGSFLGASKVEFGNVRASFNVSSDGTSLTTSVPNGARTDVIRVTTPVGVATTNDPFIVTPPFNDNFASAFTLIPAGGYLTGYNNGATLETGEPVHAAPGGTSVWYKWQPSISGRASVGIGDSNFNTLLAVYTGTSLANLTPVVSNDDIGSSNRSAVSFSVTAGKTYFVAVDGAGGAQGHFLLQWTLASGPPSNDNFANAQLLEGQYPYVNGSNLFATKEAGEPSHAGKTGGTSIWYSWTSPSTGIATFTTAGSTVDTLLGVYTGTSVNALKTISSNDDSGDSTSLVDFPAVAGTTYKIAVDGYNGVQGDIVLSGGLNANRSTISWTGAGANTNWSNPANWNLNRIPRPTDTVSIVKSGTYTVTLDIVTTIDGLIIGNASSGGVKPTLSIPARTGLTFNAGSLTGSAILALSGGTLRNNYTFEVNGFIDWTGGTWSGDHAYIGSKGTVDIHGSATKTLASEAVTNLGNMLWRDSGDIAGTDGASILNQKEFQISGDATLTWSGAGKQPSFLNDRGGRFEKIGSSGGSTPGTTHTQWSFGNDGQVVIQKGNFNIEGGGVSYGDFDIASDSLINVVKDYVFDKQTSRFTGPGYVAVIGGTTGFDVGVSSTYFTLAKGKIEGKADLSVSSKFHWTGGSMTEAGTTTLGGSTVMNIDGTDAKAIAQRNLINNGTINWKQGSIQADDSARITNNGKFNFTPGTKMTYRSGKALELSNNKGAYLTGSTTIAGNVTNLGRIQPRATIVTGAGAIQAPGNRTATDFNDGGGLISITGNLVQGGGAQIDILINGTIDPVTKLPLYGQLLIGGAVDLKANCGLTITAPSYTLKSGDQFEVMKAVSIAGDFATISYPTLPAGLVWSTAKVPGNGFVSYMLKVNAKAPTITSFTPGAGVAGTGVTITGTNLNNSNGTMPTVVFGALKVPAQSATATQIKVAIPAGAVTGKIGVVTTAGSATSATNLVIKPVIASFTPVQGAVGTVVSITGTNLITASTPKPAIKFNLTATAASDLVSATATLVKVKVPVGASGGKITLTTSDGSGASATSFGFMAAPAITSFSPVSGAVGTTMTIQGKNFVNATTTVPTVKIGTLSIPAANITSTTSTQFKVLIPATAKTGKITVTTSGGSAVSGSDFVVG